MIRPAGVLRPEQFPHFPPQDQACSQQTHAKQRHGEHDRLEALKLGAVLPPEHFDDAAIRRVHDQPFIDFLAGAHDAWAARYGQGAEAIPSCWPARGLRERRTGDIESQLGSYAFDTATPITKGTWAAAKACTKGLPLIPDELLV